VTPPKLLSARLTLLEVLAWLLLRAPGTMRAAAVAAVAIKVMTARRTTNATLDFSATGSMSGLHCHGRVQALQMMSARTAVWLGIVRVVRISAWRAESLKAARAIQLSAHL